MKPWLIKAKQFLTPIMHRIRELYSELTSTFQALSPIKQTVWLGFSLIFVFFILLGSWAALAPLESAAIASGKVISATYRKTVQHLEGGIVSKINIKEGSIVKEGDILIELEGTQAKANYEAARKQVDELLATEARLEAIRDDIPSIPFPERLLIRNESDDVKKIIATQTARFDSEKKTLSGQLEILNQRIEQLKDEIESLEAQVTASDKQLELSNKEIEAMETLDKKELIEKTRLWATQRDAAKIEGDRGEKLALIARAKQKIGETQQQIITTKDTAIQEALKELRETQVKLSEVLEKERASLDIYKRTAIVATQSGVIVNLKVHTVGGVIKPGDDILDLVPKEDALIIEARANPLDIDVIKSGMLARVQLVAFKQRSTPQLEGTVTHLSADSFQDERTHESYYLVYVKVEPEEFKKLNDENIRLYPGMPVDVMIITGRRTALSYILSPIIDSFHRAFREE